MLRLYAFFHLNIMFSSIEEAQRPEVIKRCYWPVLRLAEKLNRPIGVEATGYTLETIEKLDPEWLGACRALIERGLIEPIGSGYAQMIGPLMPAELVRWNLKLGHKTYDRLWGRRPRLALINEQAYLSSVFSSVTCLSTMIRIVIGIWVGVFIGVMDSPALNCPR